MKNNFLNQLLEYELKMSTGCTEPSAIAYAVSYAKKYISDSDNIKHIRLLLSTNVLKNALCVTLPNINIHGIELIVLLGLLCNSDDKLIIFNSISPELLKKAKELKNKICIDIDFIKSNHSLYIESNIETEKHQISTIMVNEHDVIKKVIIDGYEVVDELVNSEQKSIYDDFCYDDILDFIHKNDFNYDLLKKVEFANTSMGQYGLDNKVGICVGSNISGNSIYKDDITKVISKTVAGVDSRMSGVMKEVYINSGSGNQGIVATIPIIEYANTHNVTDEIKYQALALSHLTAIYIHSKQNKLSLTCGIEIASCGVAAGICYMLSGTANQIKGAVLNTLCANFGVFCDGAKETCSLKAMSGVSTAINAAFLARNNVFVDKNLGIISKDFETTIEMVANLEHEMTNSLDSKIMKLAIKNCK